MAVILAYGPPSLGYLFPLAALLTELARAPGPPAHHVHRRRGDARGRHSRRAGRPADRGYRRTGLDGAKRIGCVENIDRRAMSARGVRSRHSSACPKAHRYKATRSGAQGDDDDRRCAEAWQPVRRDGEAFSEEQRWSSNTYCGPPLGMLWSNRSGWRGPRLECVHQAFSVCLVTLLFIVARAVADCA